MLVYFDRIANYAIIKEKFYNKFHYEQILNIHFNIIGNSYLYFYKNSKKERRLQKDS